MSQPQRGVRIWGVIPAAGVGRRMGKPKQVLPHGRSTIVGAVARALLGAGPAGVVVVTRGGLINLLDLPTDRRVLSATNDDTDSEMLDSIRIGLAHIDRLVQAAPATVAAGERCYGRHGARPLQSPVDDGVLVIPADMPNVQAAACRACMAAYLADPSRIVIATHAGRRGHPIIFPFALKPVVERLEGGLRMLQHVCPDRVLYVETSDPAVTQDIDTLKDYARSGP